MSYRNKAPLLLPPYIPSAHIENAMATGKELPSSYYVTTRGDYTSVTKVISVKLPVGLIEALDNLIEKGYFQNRSDAIREAIRKLLSNYREMDLGRLDRGLHLGIR